MQLSTFKNTIFNMLKEKKLPIDFKVSCFLETFFVSHSFAWKKNKIKIKMASFLNLKNLYYEDNGKK